MARHGIACCSQAALIAPTSVLARQHADKLSKLVADLHAAVAAAAPPAGPSTASKQQQQPQPPQPGLGLSLGVSSSTELAAVRAALSRLGPVELMVGDTKVRAGPGPGPGATGHWEHD